MPIYKYWVIYIIQICLPLLLLAGISLFIFLQENGREEESGEREGEPPNIFNARIANATSLLLAYTAMIPVFK